MKKLAATLCSAFALCMVLCLGLASCSGVSRNDLIGTWDYDIDTLDLFVGEGLTDEQVLAARQLMFLNLYEDGSADFALFGSVQNGSWQVSGSGVSIIIGDEESPAKYENGMLTMGEGDVSLVFVKADELRSLPTEEQVAAAMEELVGSGAIEEATRDIADPQPDAQIELVEWDSPIVVADDDTVTIAVTASGTNALGDPGFNLHVTNNSDTTFYLTEGEFTLDGQAVVVYGNDVFAPGEEKDMFLAFDAVGLSDDTVVDASSDVHGVVSVNDDATTEVIASYEFMLDSSEA